ncbi:hypothetical protein BJX66DRAFT_291394 [Aspergillus keveii]|uniref:Uncharacterized protein n=1 Tax=Aspergillus keveii TaxID=714993 RepID=A0ABR4GMI1_9EURO
MRAGGGSYMRNSSWMSSHAGNRLCSSSRWLTRPRRVWSFPACYRDTLLLTTCAACGCGRSPMPFWPQRQNTGSHPSPRSPSTPPATSWSANKSAPTQRQQRSSPTSPAPAHRSVASTAPPAYKPPSAPAKP